MLHKLSMIYKVYLVAASPPHYLLGWMCDYSALLYPPAELTQLKLFLSKPSVVWQVAAACPPSALYRSREELL